MHSSIPSDLRGKTFKYHTIDEFELIINGPLSFTRYHIKQIVAIIKIEEDGTIHFEEVGWTDPLTAKELSSIGCNKGIAELNKMLAKTNEFTDDQIDINKELAKQKKKSVDINVTVKGGGTTGQSGATRLGLARALKNYNEDYLQALRDGGHLTRDSRMVERKKPGQRGARRRFQFSKR